MRKLVLSTIMVSALVALTGCSKKLGELTSDNFTVTPTPLENHGGEVTATINGNFPEKYMLKKAVVTVTPVLKYGDKEATSQSATFQGEKVLDNNTTINYKVGGNYTMKATFPYNEDMLSSDLYARFDAKIGKKVVTIPEVKIGYGVLSTGDLAKNCLSTVSGSQATDAYQRTIDKQQEATIKFLIAQANLRTSELESPSLQDLLTVLRQANDSATAANYALKDVQVSAYASPDGKYDFNEKLAEQRQNVSVDYLKKEVSGLDSSAITTKYTAEDWEGFQQIINSSNFEYKTEVLDILSKYEDPEQREAKMKEMGDIFPQIADSIMPELRRSRMIVNYQVIGRSDAQIAETFKSDPSQLSVEELIYGANKLAKTDSEKESWYKTAIKNYSSDYRAYNNLAQLYLNEGETSKAEDLLKKAAKLNKDGQEIGINQALAALRNGDAKQAETLLGNSTKAAGYKEMLGNVELAKGNYAAAAKDLAGVNSNSAALAQLLTNDYTSAKKTLQNVTNSDATTSYLKALVAARQKDSSSVVSNLRDAISQDSNYAKRAINDLEFADYKTAIENLIK